MKTTSRLLIAFAAPLLTAAPASAWHCHRAGMMTMPMMGMPMMGMPMMGMGMMPTIPITGFGLMGAGTLPVLPTAVGGGAGFQMSMTMSGDPTMLLLMPGLIRNLLGQFLGPQGTAGLTDAQIQALADRIRGVAVLAGANPMTAQQAENLLLELRKIREQLPQQLPKPGGPGGQLTPEGKPKPEEQALAQAREAVRRLVAEGAARRTAAAPRDLEQARAEVRKLVAAGAARPAKQGASDLEQARAAVRKLVAEGAARQTGRSRPAGVTVAGGAK